MREFFLQRASESTSEIHWDEERNLAYIERDGQREYIIRTDGRPYTRDSIPSDRENSFLATANEIARGKSDAGYDIPQPTAQKSSGSATDPYLSPPSRDKNNLIDPDAGAFPDSIEPESTPIIQREQGKENPFGDEVFQLQEALQKKGFDIGSDGVDGYYGPNTEEAVRQFQKQNGMEPSGVVDSRTWSLIFGARR